MMEGNQTNTGVSVGRDLHARDISVVQHVKNIIQTFTGRKAFLEELHTLVKEGQEGGEERVTILTQEPLSVVAATGGIGKTETVRKYIQLYGHEYDHIIWIDAEENSFAQAQFLQLATELKISTMFEGKQKKFESILKEIFGKLLVNAHVVLLIFDNAEAMEDDEELSLSGIKSLRPTSLSPFFVEPTIIVTSRNQNWRHQKVIQLDLWSEAEVVLFVTGQLKLDENSESKTLALQLGNLFGRLPIALQAAVAVILQQIKRRKKYGIQSLIDEYESGSRKVLAQKPADAKNCKNMGDTMLVLWNISLEKIVRYEDGKLAIKILCFMAYMSQTRIPQDFLFALCKTFCTKDSFENALEVLEDYSLIASVCSGDVSDFRSFSIHRMIQDSTIQNLRTRLTNEGQTPHTIFNKTTFLNEFEVLLKLSAESVNYLKSFTQLTFPRSRELDESLIQITNHVSKQIYVEEFRDLTKGTAWFLRMTNNFSKFIELFEKVLDYLETKFILAIHSSDEEEKKVALELMTEKLKEQEKDPNSNSGFIKATQLSKELMLGHKCHLEEASHVCLKAIEDATKSFGPSGLTTLKFRHAYALVLYEQGKLDLAARILLELLETYKTQL